MKLDFSWFRGGQAALAALLVAPIVYYHNVALLYDIQNDYSWLWIPNALFAFFIAQNNWLQGARYRLIGFLLLLWAGYQIGSIASLEWQFAVSYFLTDAIEVLQVGVISVLLYRIRQFDALVEFRPLLKFAGQLAIVVILANSVQSAIVAWLNQEAFFTIWVGWTLSALIPVGLAFLATYASTDKRQSEAGIRYLVIPFAAAVWAAEEFVEISIYLDHLLFAVSAALLLLLPLRHLILPLCAVVFAEFLTLPSELWAHNSIAEFAAVSPEEISLTLTVYVLTLLALAILLERLSRESQRASRLDRSLDAGLRISGSYVVEVDAQTLVARYVGGESLLDTGVMFDAKRALEERLSPDSLHAGLELLQQRNSKATLKFIDPESGEFAFWGRLWISNEYELSGRPTFLLVRQIVTEEVNLTEALENSLQLRNEAEQVISLSIYDVDMDTLEGVQVVGDLQQEFAELPGSMLDRMRLAMLPHDYELAKQRLADSNCVGIYDYRIPLDADGRNSIWLRVHYGSERQIDGHRKRFVLSWDVTAEKSQLDKLASYERRLAAAVTGSGLGIFEYNVKTDTIWVNEVGRSYLHIPDWASEEHSMQVHRDCLADDTLEQLGTLLTRSRDGVGDVSGEVGLRWRNDPGQVRYCLVSARSTENSRGEPIVVGSMVDITLQQEALKRAELALAQAEASQTELVKMSERQARMFAVIGHELRTPASAVNMMLEATPRQQLGEYGDSLLSSSAQLLQVLDDLRAVVQPDELRKASLETASPALVVRQTAMSSELQLGAQGVVLHLWTHEAAEHECHFNLQALRQILTILLRNVAVHSQASNVWVSLYQRKVEGDSAVLQLKVEDDGSGVPQEHRERLFESFYRVDQMREGSGLGLSIAASLAENLGGGVEYFESTHGGAGFRLTMRLQQALVPEAPLEAKPQAFDFDGCSVLLAEDNPTIQLLTSTILKKAGARVTIASDGEEALELFDKDSAIDLVITDIFMPNLDGFGLTEKLRERGFTGVILGATAATVGEETGRLKSLGASAVLSKPLTLTTLKRTLTDLSSV